MSRETEKLMKELENFLALHADEVVDEESANRLTNQFLQEHVIGRAVPGDAPPETADDYLDLADEAPSKKKRIAYLQKALELEPDHVDAQLQLIFCTLEDKEDEQLPLLQALLQKAAAQMEEEGCFEEYMGDFWLAPETRPYMRVRHAYFHALIACGMLRCAIDEGERLLELCTNDNLGVRYSLMHLYACLEDELHALALHKQFEGREETQMLLPLAALYYKLNQFDKAEDYVRRLAAVNRDAKKFFRAAAADKLEPLFEEMDPYGYRPGTMDELLGEALGNYYLFKAVPFFFRWASESLRKTSPAGKKSAKKS